MSFRKAETDHERFSIGCACLLRRYRDLTYKKIFPALQAMVKRGASACRRPAWPRPAEISNNFAIGRTTLLRGMEESIARHSTSCAACFATWMVITTTRAPFRRFARNLVRRSGQRTISPYRHGHCMERNQVYRGIHPSINRLRSSYRSFQECPVSTRSPAARGERRTSSGRYQR